MSYVFSKALQTETPEEKERRIKAQQERWKANNAAAAAAAYGKPHPPAVAHKPKQAPPVKKDSSGIPPSPRETTAQKSGLTSRSFSVDDDYGTSPKMGGKKCILFINCYLSNVNLVTRTSIFYLKIHT